MMMNRTSVIKLAKNWLSPILQDYIARLLGRRIKIVKKFRNWNDAEKHGIGYDSNEILRRVKLATNEVIRNPNISERDGMVFHEKLYSFPLVSTLLIAWIQAQGRLEVLDFGGSLGSTFYQCQNYLAGMSSVKWCIVEQKHFAELGKNEFQTENLKFFKSIEECYQNHKPNLVLFSGVLQYLKCPSATVEEILKEQLPEYIVIDRTPVIDAVNSIIALQFVPNSLGKASYPIRLFNLEELIALVGDMYSVQAVFSAIDSDIFYGSKLISYKGIVFKRN